MQGAKCAISKLMYGSSVCIDNNHSKKLVAFCLVHTDGPNINLYKDITFEYVIPQYILHVFLTCVVGMDLLVHN